MDEIIYSYVWNSQRRKPKRYKHRVTDLVTRVNAVLHEELQRLRVPYRSAEGSIISSINCVGEQGDCRTYGPPAQISIDCDEGVLSYGHLAQISTRITNEIFGINRVLYVLRSK